MKLHKFTHALLKTPVYCDLDLLFSFYHSASTNATHLMAAGGAMVPIAESVDEVSRAKSGEFEKVSAKTERTPIKIKRSNKK